MKSSGDQSSIYHEHAPLSGIQEYRIFTQSPILILPEPAQRHSFIPSMSNLQSLISLTTCSLLVGSHMILTFEFFAFRKLRFKKGAMKCSDCDLPDLSGFQLHSSFGIVCFLEFSVSCFGFCNLLIFNIKGSLVLRKTPLIKTKTKQIRNPQRQIRTTQVVHSGRGRNISKEILPTGCKSKSKRFEAVRDAHLLFYSHELAYKITYDCWLDTR